MDKLQVKKCHIEGLCVIAPVIQRDDRGYFFESYNQNDMHEAGLDVKFVQDNQSMSVKGVLRGLHFQKKHQQGKLVRAIKGRVFDVAVDLRAGSATYGQWYGLQLTDENKLQFYIPEGFAHGFLALSDVVEFCYKTTDFYHPNDEDGIAWNDPAIGIDWPEVAGKYQGATASGRYALNDGTRLILSEKDQQWGSIMKIFAGAEQKNFSSLYKNRINE